MTKKRSATLKAGKKPAKRPAGAKTAGQPPTKATEPAINLPIYEAKPKPGYGPLLEFDGTPTHPAYREGAFTRLLQLDRLEAARRKGKPYYVSLLEAITMQGANRRRIELEQEVADRVALYNDLALRMQEQLPEQNSSAPGKKGKTTGKRSNDVKRDEPSLDQLVLPYVRPRTHLEKYDDKRAILAFIERYWEITEDNAPIPRERLQQQVETAYGHGRTAADVLFQEEYKGPGISEEFYKQADSLIKRAQKEVKAGRLK